MTWDLAPFVGQADEAVRELPAGATYTTPVDQLEADYLTDVCNRIGCDNVADWSLLLTCTDVLGVCSACRPHTLDWLREHPIVKCAVCHTDSLFARDFVWERRR